MQEQFALAATGSVCPSYDEAHGVLESTFSQRGKIGSLISESTALDRRIAADRLEYPSAFVYSDVMAADSRNRYRTGRDADGNSFMTLDDLCRLAGDDERRAGAGFGGAALRRMSEERSDETVQRNVRPAHLYTIRDGRTAPNALAMRRETVVCGDRFTRMTLKNVRRESAVAKAYDKVAGWLGGGQIVRSGISSRQVSGLVAAVSLVLVFAIVLVMPILMSVLIHNEATTVRVLENELAQKEKTAAALETELDAKNDRFMLETLARDKYGMIPVDKSAFRILKIAPSDSVTVSESQRTTGAVPALLSALGIRLGQD